MVLVPFQPEHLFALTPPIADPGALERFARLYRPAGPAWTVRAGGVPVACGGIVVEGDIGRGWAMLSHPVRTVAIHRAARAALAEIHAAGTVRQIQARALEEWDGACRWLERLGFHAVGRDGPFRIYRQ